MVFFIAQIIKGSLGPIGSVLFVGGGVALACEYADLDLSEQWAFITSLCLLIGGIVMKIAKRFATGNAWGGILGTLGTLCIPIGAIMLAMNRLGMKTEDMADWVKYLTMAIMGLGAIMFLIGKIGGGMSPMSGLKKFKKINRFRQMSMMPPQRFI